jgi:hypothetical protein
LLSSSAPQAAKTADINISPSVTLYDLIQLTKESYRGHYKAYTLKKIPLRHKCRICNGNVI